ncbi:MAG TPA: hypothetical protein VLX92_11885 [Kofleriaceae bacterium]|nr:hypothetical protein [Kofleriaceae bacterium]
MKTTLAILLLGTAVAGAAPATKCGPVHGTPIYENDHKDTRATEPTRSVKVYDNGSWMFEVTTPDGKVAASSSGCLDESDLKQVRADLKKAKWKISHPRIHCMAISSSYSVLKVDGKEVFEAHTCGNDVLDDVSARSEADIEKIIAPAWQSGAALTTPPASNGPIKAQVANPPTGAPR